MDDDEKETESKRSNENAESVQKLNSAVLGSVI